MLVRRARIFSVVVVATMQAAVPAYGAQPLMPYKQIGRFELVKDWTFGNARANATVRNKEQLGKEFYFRLIYAEGKKDQLPTYWSYHRDYPDGDPRSLHVFTANTLVLKGRIPPGGGLKNRGIESGILRAKIPVTTGMYIEMRAKMPTGIGVWPAFWLNPGVQYSDREFSELPWPPEIDIFEFFNWKTRPQTRVMSGYVQTHGHPERYGPPRDLWSKFTKGEYTPGFDFSADFHVFALDWREDQPIWLLDGEPIKETHYEWRAPPAHLIVSNQIGIAIPGTDLTGMIADESQWDYTIDYIRVWKNSYPEPPRDVSVK